MAFIRFNGLAVSWFVSVFLLPACGFVGCAVSVLMIGFGCLRGFRFVVVLPLFLWPFSLFPAVLAVCCCRGNIGIRFRPLCWTLGLPQASRHRSRHFGWASCLSDLCVCIRRVAGRCVGRTVSAAPDASRTGQHRGASELPGG